MVAAHTALCSTFQRSVWKAFLKYQATSTFQPEHGFNVTTTTIHDATAVASLLDRPPKTARGLGMNSGFACLKPLGANRVPKCRN